MPHDDKPALNTDRELWRETDDYYAPSIHVTQGGGIGMNVGGTVHVLPIEKWHALASEYSKSGDDPAGTKPPDTKHCERCQRDINLIAFSSHTCVLAGTTPDALTENELIEKLTADFAYARKWKKSDEWLISTIAVWYGAARASSAPPPVQHSIEKYRECLEKLAVDDTAPPAGQGRKP